MLKIEPKENRAEVGLGVRLRLRRKARGLTMQTVADSAGLTVGFISQVERDIAAPSLASLTSIAHALGSHVSDFLQPPRNEHEKTQADMRQMYSLPGGAISYERLSTTFPGSQLTSVVVHHPPHHKSEPMRHKGEELYLILEGEISVFVDDQESVLGTGDTIHFDSNRLHFVFNRSDKPAKLLICNTMDVFGENT